jgi:hypothetical protein
LLNPGRVTPIPLLLLSVITEAVGPAVPATNEPARPIDQWMRPPEVAPEGGDHAVLTGPTPRPSPSPAPESDWARLARRWYGWQLALSDAAFLTLGHFSPQGAGTRAASIGLVAVPPLLHFAHGDWKYGVTSAFMRGAVLLTAIHYGITWAARKRCTSPVAEVCDDEFNIGDLLKGVALSFAGAGVVALDDVVLSIKGDAVRPTPVATGPSFTPTLSPTTGGLAMGLMGVF